MHELPVGNRTTKGSAIVNVLSLSEGEKQEYSLLFSHAQDTLMVIYSEIITAKQLVQVFKSFDDRIKKLEEL